jgi:hypothetical protein
VRRDRGGIGPLGGERQGARRHQSREPAHSRDGARCAATRATSTGRTAMSFPAGHHDAMRPRRDR